MYFEGILGRKIIFLRWDAIHIIDKYDREAIRVENRFWVAIRVHRFSKCA